MKSVLLVYLTTLRILFNFQEAEKLLRNNDD